MTLNPQHWAARWNQNENTRIRNEMAHCCGGFDAMTALRCDHNQRVLTLELFAEIGRVPEEEAVGPHLEVVVRAVKLIGVS